MKAQPAIAILLLYGWAATGRSAADGSIPDAQSMKKRVLESMRRSEEALENYSCTVRERSEELDSNGAVKKHRSALKEQFFVNRIEIEHTLEREGKPLKPDEAKKEQERVDKEVKKFSDRAEAQKAQRNDEKQADMFLRALRLTNGRREQRSGRSTLLYDLSGDPNFHPKKIEERFAQALTGRIEIDEESGTPVNLHFETVRDIKIGAGLLANLHKGFWLNLAQQREPDGVWIIKNVQGSGDARAALFVHARFRFAEELDKCHRFSVNTQQNVHSPAQTSSVEPKS